ncbi:MAG: response regulator, partial [Thermoproteota archaeon]|nr:response regulator [Thermoproteota archaeon]
FYIAGVDLTSYSERGRSERKETPSKNLMVKNHSQIDSTTARKQQPFWKRILIIDDDPDITLTFKSGIEDSKHNQRIEVITYNEPLKALSEFKPDFYDLLLVDINLPQMNGFELSEKILKMDINVKVCFMSAGGVNREAMREIYPAISFGCFIKKPVTIDYLVKRIMAELD